MSKIILLADLHGNMTATLAVEKEIKQLEPDEIWSLGDITGKGPESDKTCDWVKKNCKYCLAGNWDQGIFEQRIKTHAYYEEQLGKERLEWLRNLPQKLELNISGICFRIVHGRPVTAMLQGNDSDEFLSSFFDDGDKTYGGIICADSHRPFVRLTDRGYIMNTGSVGMGYGQPKAHALLLEGEKDCTDIVPLRITILSIPYDNEKEAQIARESVGFPKREAYIREILTGVRTVD